MSESGELHRETEREEVARTFIETDNRFVCMFAKQTLEQGRGIIRELPISPVAKFAGFDREHAAVQSCLEESFRRIAENELDFIAFVDPTDPKSHGEAYMKTWAFFYDMLVTDRQMQIRHPLSKQEKLQYWNRAVRMTDPKNIPEYENQVAGVGDQPLFLTAMNSLYATEPAVHTRWAPVPLYAVVRASTVMRAQKEKRRASEHIHMQMSERAGEVYNNTLPYVLPGDERFLHPSHLDILTRMKESLPGLNGKKPFDVYRLVQKEILALMQASSQGRDVDEAQRVFLEAFYRAVGSAGESE